MSERPKISQDATERARKTRKRRELALLIPLVGCLVILSPIMDGMGIGSADISRRYIAVFVVWACLIAAAYVLSRLLRPQIEED